MSRLQVLVLVILVQSCQAALNLAECNLKPGHHPRVWQGVGVQPYGHFGYYTQDDNMVLVPLTAVNSSYLSFAVDLNKRSEPFYFKSERIIPEDCTYVSHMFWVMHKVAFCLPEAIDTILIVMRGKTNKQV